MRWNHQLAYRYTYIQYTMISCGLLYIPGGAGSLPSTVSMDPGPAEWRFLTNITLQNLSDTTKDSAASTKYSTIPCLSLKWWSHFFYGSEIYEILLVSVPDCKEEASTPNKTLAHPRKLTVWSWKGPSKFAGREHHFGNLCFLASTNTTSTIQ